MRTRDEATPETTSDTGNVTRVDEGTKAEPLSRSKCKARTVVGRGQKSLLCDSDLSDD